MLRLILQMYLLGKIYVWETENEGDPQVSLVSDMYIVLVSRPEPPYNITC